MKDAGGLLLAVSVLCESGCSGGENVKCRGVYRVGADNGAISTGAVLGFHAEPAPILARLISPTRNWQGFVDVSYVANPYGEASKNGGGILNIESDDEESISASEKGKNASKLLFYNKSDGAVTYYDNANTFSGLCRRDG
jgi:hypothetical protein